MGNINRHIVLGGTLFLDGAGSPRARTPAVVLGSLLDDYLWWRLLSITFLV